MMSDKSLEKKKRLRLVGSNKTCRVITHHINSHFLVGFMLSECQVPRKKKKKEFCCIYKQFTSHRVYFKHMSRCLLLL